MFKDFMLFVYFFIVIIIGFYSFRKIKNNNDFFIAGKSAGVLEVTGSLLASILGSSAIIGSVDFSYSKGWAGSSLMLCASLGLMILYPLVKYLHNFKGYNLPNLLGSFYGAEVEKISSLVISIAWIGIVASQIIGAAKIITILSSFNYIQGVWISGLVFMFYTLLGGQLSILKTDFIQFLFIIVGIILTFIFIIKEPINITPLPFINENFSIGDLIVLILTYSTTFFVGPDIYSRLFCARDEKTMKKSILIAIAVLIPLAFILARIGIYGASNFSKEILGSESVLLMIAHKKLSKIVAFMLFFGLLSAVISSADTTLLTAASLSAQIFTKDLRNKNAIRITRIFTIIFSIFSILIAIRMKYILKPLFMALSIYSGAFIIPTIAGIFGYRGSKKRVFIAIITGGLFAFIGKIIGGNMGNIISIMAFFINGSILLIKTKPSKS